MVQDKDSKNFRFSAWCCYILAQQESTAILYRVNGCLQIKSLGIRRSYFVDNLILYNTLNFQYLGKFFVQNFLLAKV